MSNDFDPRRLDVRRFAAAGAELSGNDPLPRHERLLAETEGGAERQVRWSARGELLHPQHVQPEVWLHLQAETRLPLVCQRCLNPVEVTVSVDRSFRFVADEATAAAEDDESEEDLLAISRSFNLPELVEDELLMELPVAPRHEVCPEPVKMAVADPAFHLASEAKENPFAVLERLKGGGKN